MLLNDGQHVPHSLVLRAKSTERYQRCLRLQVVSSIAITQHRLFVSLQVTQNFSSSTQETEASVMANIKGPEDVVSVDVHDAKQLLGSGYRYLDVRTPEEFNKSHVDDAIDVPYMFVNEEGGRVKNPEFLNQVVSLCKKEDYLVVGCNSGGRSLRASVDLLNAGFEHARNMEGGYSKWVDGGLAGDNPAEGLKTACKFRP